MVATEQAIWELLDQVKDPEIPIISIVELGIAREVNISSSEGSVEVVITPTYSGCPAMREIEADIRDKLAENDFPDVTIRTVLTPAWTTDWMSKSGKEKLQDFGIAPPERVQECTSVIPLQSRIKCPRCDSLKTRLVSEFGSTACKSLYQCENCLEPFDYFKPL